MRVQKMRSELIDRAKAAAHVARLSRRDRDSWLNWPARISAALATELGIDPEALHIELERQVNFHINELGDVNPSFR